MHCISLSFLLTSLVHASFAQQLQAFVTGATGLSVNRHSLQRRDGFCGYADQISCASNEVCITTNDIAYCMQSVTQSWEIPITPTPSFPTCKVSEGEISCGSMCCAQSQICVYPGQCSSIPVTTTTYLTTSIEQPLPSQTPICNAKGDFTTDHILGTSTHFGNHSIETCSTDCSAAGITGCVSFAALDLPSGIQCTIFDAPVSEVFIKVVGGSKDDTGRYIFFDLTCFSTQQPCSTASGSPPIRPTSTIPFLSTSAASQTVIPTSTCGHTAYILDYDKSTDSSPLSMGTLHSDTYNLTTCKSECLHPHFPGPKPCLSWATSLGAPGMECYFFGAPVKDVELIPALGGGQGPVVGFYDVDCVLSSSTESPSSTANLVGNGTATPTPVMNEGRKIGGQIRWAWMLVGIFCWMACIV